MIAGQILDIEAEEKQMDDLSLLRLTHRCKTGALILASVEFGACLGEATEKQLYHLRSYAHNIGLAFQIVDDILDVIDSEQKHGKPTASDITNHKRTYVSLVDLEKSQEEARELLQGAIDHLQHLHCDTNRLKDIALLIGSKMERTA